MEVDGRDSVSTSCGPKPLIAQADAIAALGWEKRRKRRKDDGKAVTSFFVGKKGFVGFLFGKNPKDSVAVVALGDDEEEIEEGCGEGGQEKDGESVEPVGG